MGRALVGRRVLLASRFCHLDRMAPRRPARGTRSLHGAGIYLAGAGLMAGRLTPSPFADMIVACIGYGLTWLSVALFAAYPSLFGRPLSPLRKSLTWLAYASAGGVAIYEAARLWMTWTGALPWVAQSVAPDWNFIYGAVPYLLALATAWAGTGKRSRR